MDDSPFGTLITSLLPYLQCSSTLLMYCYCVMCGEIPVLLHRQLLEREESAGALSCCRKAVGASHTVVLLLDRESRRNFKACSQGPAYRPSNSRKSLSQVGDAPIGFRGRSSLRPVRFSSDKTPFCLQREDLLPSRPPSSATKEKIQSPIRGLHLSQELWSLVCQ